MSREQKKMRALQWHPAFYAGIQIEFGEEAKYLEFYQEYLLGTKPKQIDILVIKKEESRALHKNIGKIFRKHNVIEYKGPSDSLAIDDFYKVCGYAYFYKSTPKEADGIRFDELTISFVSERYPRELFRHLRKERKLRINKEEQGIYYVVGESLPIQIIITRQLSQKENLWLRNLTNRMESAKEAEELLEDYQKHKHDERYESMMEIIMRANEKRFEEAKEMCKALEELMKEELEAKKQEGEAIGKEIGKERVNELILKLSDNGRFDDIVKAASDKAYQEKLFLEFGL